MSTSSVSYQGGCLCGEVRFMATGEPLTSAICHCRSCQRAFGAESVAWACFKPEQVEWQGEPRKIFRSSSGVERSFCSRCGTSMSYQAENNTLDLAIACMDDPESLSPEREVYLSHRISWNASHPDLPGFQKFMSDE